MSMFKKILAVVLGLAVLSGLGWMVYGRIVQAMKPAEVAGRGGGSVAVEVTPITHGTIRDVRTLTGSLRARAQFEVAPRIPGRVERLMVDIGDVVRRGQLIALLDDAEYQQQVEQARAELLVAQANLDEKKSTVEIVAREFARVQQLHQQQFASDSELDSARSRYQAEQAAVKVAEAQVAQRQAALRAAEVRLSYTRITADWHEPGETRVVGERFVDEGATVSANAPLVSLLEIDTLIAIVHVTEAEHRALRIGQPADLLASGNDARVATGRVVRIAPVFREGTRQARIEIEVPNASRELHPGMFVRVNIELRREDNATIVPRQALVRRDGRQGVFLVDNTGPRPQARFVPVQPGIAERDRVQVLEPPQMSGMVVTLGQHLLGDGLSVTVVQVNAPRMDQAVAGEVGR